MQRGSMKRLVLIAWASTFVISGTAAAREPVVVLTPQPAANQTLEAFRGYPALSSTASLSGVVLILTTEKFVSSIGPVFLLGVKNVASSEIGIDAPQISATSDAGAVVVLTAEEMKRIARLQHSIMQENAASQAAVARSPGNPSVREDYNRSYADRRMAAAQEQMADAEQLRRGALETAEETGFKPFKVPVGQTVFAPVRFFRIPDKATKVDIRFEVNGETHRFAYAVKRIYR